MKYGIVLPSKVVEELIEIGNRYKVDLYKAVKTDSFQQKEALNEC
ncbi:hypothetical protein [Metabacillus litoralis]